MLIKQPNGKYCYVKGNEIKENLTEEEYKCMRFDQFMNQLSEELKKYRFKRNPIPYFNTRLQKFID